MVWARVAIGRATSSYLFDWNVLYVILSFVACIFFGVGIWHEGRIVGEDLGQIDALKGVQTHGIYYVYPKGDTIPSDTLYIKIK